MKIIRDLSSLPESCKGAVVALGNFDGVHLGHQAILAHAKEIAQQTGKPFAAMTFSPHPREFFDPKKGKLRIYSFRKKAQFLAACGVDYLFVLPFNERLANTTAQDFVQHMLHEKLAVSHVVTGYNFYFGKDRSGNKDFLRAQAKELGFGFTAHAPVIDKNDHALSSSRIRTALQSGDIKAASAMLGRDYSMTGHVIHGDKRGRKIGFPTANIKPYRLFLPRFGVYAVQVHLPDGHALIGVANLGIRPTFDRHLLFLEVHVVDFSGDLYGQRLEIQFMDFIREEMRFENLSFLQAQIVKDIMQMRVMSKYWRLM